jgi:hypothetical protein
VHVTAGTVVASGRRRSYVSRNLERAPSPAKVRRRGRRVQSFAV